MRYASVCDGIGAVHAAWQPLGWQCAWTSEIEPFPAAVVEHHWKLPNLGDMTKITEAQLEDHGRIDLLVGGTPCQSFSVAGLRGGLDDPRGNLTLEFLKLAQRIGPKWIVWENVPGVISDKGNALACFLDGLEELGYIVDVEILDAQFHGLPQRRRRVFVCGQHVSDLLSRTTSSSALTIAQCLQEILHGILVSACQESGSVRQNSVSAYLSRDGVTRRMRLFGLDGEADNWTMLRANLIAECQRCQAAPKPSAAHLGVSEKERTPEGPSMDSREDAQYTRTDELLRQVLDESYEVMRSFITLTPTSSITPDQIFTCSQAVLHIARLTVRSNQSSPSFWSAASSSLTALAEFTEYARQANSDLFGDMERIPAWTDFIREAKPTVEALGNLRISSFGKVLPLSESLSGDSPPRREAGEGIAVGVEASTGSISHCLNAGGMGRQDYESETLIAHTLRGDGFDASEDGTGRGTPLVPVAFDCKGTDCQPGDISPTLRSMNHNASHANAGGQVAVATCIPIDMRQASRGATMTNNRSDGACSGGAPGTGIGEAGDPSPTVSTSHPPAVAFTQNQCGDVLTGPVMPSMGTSQNATGRNTPKVQLGLAVRRLTPRECERLQGFSDNYTAITYRNKPAADGPRYKALGNSMAVPCVRWIAERIELADALNTGKDS